MRKKILAIALTAALLSIAIVGTLAYLTDTDNKDNQFKTSATGVDIELIEKQRNADHSALEDFEQDKLLLPIVGVAQGEKDEFGMPVAKNYVDKMVTIKNNSDMKVWMRAYFAIPSALDDGSETFNAGLNILHFNFGNFKHTDGNWYTTYKNQWKWLNDAGQWKYYETTIEDVAYNVYFADYYMPVEAGATTEQLISGVYLDSNVNMRKDAEGNMHYYIVRDNVETEIENFPATVICPVYVVAVQHDGFNSVKEAIDTAFGAKYNPWGGTVNNWQE